MQSYSGFDEVQHTADWEIRVRGRSLEELFTNSILGMQRLAGIELDSTKIEAMVFQIDAGDHEGLLVKLLEEILFFIETRRMGVLDIEFSFSGKEINVNGKLAPVVNLEKEIKAVTWNNLAINKNNQGYSVNIVFDV